MRVEVNNGSARRRWGSVEYLIESQRVSRIVGWNETGPAVFFGRMSWWVLRRRRHEEVRRRLEFRDGKGYHQVHVREGRGGLGVKALTQV